jgi:hypothetical protein
MSEDVERIEEELRSEIYEALVESGRAEKPHKPDAVHRLHAACGKLRDLIKRHLKIGQRYRFK